MRSSLYACALPVRLVRALKAVLLEDSLNNNKKNFNNKNSSNINMCFELKYCFELLTTFRVGHPVQFIYTNLDLLS